MQRLIPSLMLCGLLAACGGGGGGYGGGSAPPPPPPPEPLVPGTLVPVNATTSPAAATAFARNSFPADIESLEPLELGDAQLAVSDTDEPSE